MSLNSEQRKVVDHPDSICLSAGAGSGKTRTLVEKYLKLLIDEDRNPAEILAITFTEKAAAEMLTRIRAALRGAIQSETDPQACGHLEEKLMNLGGGWISTIHAFGARVLREHPAEAGVDPAFVPLPESEADILWELAAGGAVMEMAETDPRVGELALRLGLRSGGRGSSSSLIGILFAIKAQLDAQGRGPEDIVSRTDGAGGRLRSENVREALKKVLEIQNPGATLLKKFKSWETLDQDLAQDILTSDHFLRSLAKAGWDETKERLMPGGTLKGAEKPVFEKLQDAVTAAAAQAAEICAYDQASTLIRILRQMWKNAEREKIRRRALDFGDLELKTFRLLRDHPAVVESYQDRFKHILVDEYQDVNLVQARIIQQLAANRSDSLFAVGDPKQSIYRFRGADIRQFQTLWTEMEKRKAAFHLKSNYRSHPNLVRAINLFFDQRIFCGNPPVEMVPGLDRKDGDDRPRIQWLSFDPGDTLSTGRRELEARTICRHILRLIVSAEWTYGDFALLFRATSSLYLYEEAMRRENIPYELVKAGTAFRSQEVLDILNTLTIMVDPSDKIRWLGFLRSPLGGISDDGILALTRCAQGDVRDFFLGRADLPDRMDSRDRDASIQARRLFEEGSRVERRRRTPLSLIDWILEQSAYPAVLKTLDPSGARMRSVDALRTLAAQYGSHRPDPYMGFLAAAWRMVDRKERETAADAPAQDRVKLMTIHQAKGLEFPVVILPDLLRSEATRPPDFYLTGNAGGLNLAGRVKLAGRPEKFPSPSWTAAKQIAEEDESEEQKRLLYVAMTRAKDLLILPGPDQHVLGNSIWERIYLFLKESPEWVEHVSAPADTGPAADVEPPLLLDRVESSQIRIDAMPMRTASPGLIMHKATSFGSASSTDVARAVPRGGERRRSPDARMAVSLGTLAHELLQEVCLSAAEDQQRSQVMDLLESRLEWMSIPKKLSESLGKNISQFLRSPLAERLRREARRVRREYPFMFLLSEPMSETSALGAPEALTRRDGEPQPVYVNGKVDLLIFNDDGIEIYDYKYAAPRGDFGEYEGQLMAYALAACKAFDLSQVTVGLQFLIPDQKLLKKVVGREEAESCLLAGQPAL